MKGFAVGEELRKRLFGVAAGAGDEGAGGEVVGVEPIDLGAGGGQAACTSGVSTATGLAGGAKESSVFPK